MSARSHHLHKVGDTYQQFKLTQINEISELKCTLRQLIHEPTGATVMHIGNDDPENLFCLSFQTLPYNSNGVAHILEHTVLCGSKKFPVKDPFFAMNRRSLNTFMNALTGSDFTCFPAATQVPKDFYNLLEVYLDAVFNPLLHELSFLQEGHRLEFKEGNDPKTPLTIKGIVYNEMKGALSSPSARLMEAINAALFPNITYGYNSGGDPKDIPSLTYEELQQFHKVYYHPSRCLFFFYGNMPLEPHLDFIAKETLNSAHKLPPLPPIPLQPRYLMPVRREVTYPSASGEDLSEKTDIAFAWLTCNIRNQHDILALDILEIVLMGTDASPLKRTLLASGLCKQAQSTIDNEINEIPWMIILKGCQGENADAVEVLIMETLKKICQDGIPLESIESAIHQLEFYRSEITGDSAPFGLSLFMRSALLKQHGVDPIEGLTIHSLFDRLRHEAVADPNYFTNLIQKHLLDNRHFIRIVQRPDPELEKKENDEETQKLAEMKKKLSETEQNNLLLQAKELHLFQKLQEEEDIDTLPKVSLSDVPLAAKNYSLIQEQAGNITVFHHATFTNHIAYADLAFKLPPLQEEELAYLRLLTVLLPQVGSGGRSYDENLRFMQSNTGGFDTVINFNVQAHDHLACSPSIHFRGKALNHKLEKLFTLLDDTVNSVSLDDVKRIKEVLVKHFVGMESRLNQNALRYAINLSASQLSPISKLANDMYGLNYFWKVQEIVKNFDNRKDEFLSQLKAILQKVTSVPRMPHLVLSCDDEAYCRLKTHGFYGLEQMNVTSSPPWQMIEKGASVPDQGRAIASSVAFIGKVFPTVSYVSADAPALNIASALFDNLTLHRQIREQGGAYGGGAVSSPLSGHFYFYSYRDPNISSTLAAFEEAIDTVAKGDFDENDLEEAKLEIIQDLDSPVAPGSRGEIAYSWLREGRTLDLRQAFRTRLLALTKEEVMGSVERIIVPNYNKGSAVVFAGREQLEAANKMRVREGVTPLPIERV